MRETWLVAAPACSFCRKDQEETKALIAGPSGVFICEACVALCAKSLTEGSVELPVVVTDHESNFGSDWRLRGGHVAPDPGSPRP